MAYRPPTTIEARTMAELLECGVPAEDCVRLIDPVIDASIAKDVARRWEKDGAVRAAQVQLQGADWRSLSDEKRIEVALRKHYNQLAYYLATADYAALSTERRAIADKARDVLEKRKAGTSGQSDPVTAWFEAFQQKAAKGEIKLAPSSERVQ